jgi:hypothetical protein
MYRPRYINKIEQFGRTSYTLILEDLEGAMPIVRLDKEFGCPSAQIDDEMLYQAASVEIKAANQAYSDYLAAQVLEAAADDGGDQ